MALGPKDNPMSHLTWRQWGAVALTLILGAGLTLGGYLLAREVEGDRVRAALKSKASEYHRRLQHEMVEAIQAVRAIKALFDASSHVSRDEFETFTTRFLHYSKGVRALEWAPRVPHSQRESLVKAARQDGAPNYEITEPTADGRMQKAADREVYFPVYFVVPLKGNEPVLGFDAGPRLSQGRPFQQAIDTGNIVATEGIQLLQEKKRHNGIIVFKPVYFRGKDVDTVENRRRNLRGFAAGVFSIPDLISTSLAGTTPAGIDFTIYDMSTRPKPQTLYFHRTRAIKTASGMVDESQFQPTGDECSFLLEVADRQWKVVYQATQWFVDKSTTQQPLGVMGLGLLATLLLFLSVLGLIRRGISLDRANEQLEKDLAERQRVGEEKALLAEVGNLINNAKDRREMLEALLALLQSWSGCEAVGVRLRDGDDYPYFETKGFPGSFTRLENSLCNHDENGELLRDENNEPILDCMCGNILQGRVDPNHSFFTNGGSFWSSDTTELLATTTEEDRQGRTRNRCNAQGYESLALIPLRSGNETFGLIQLNDKHTGCFTAEKVAVVERIASSVASFLAKLQADEERERLFQQWKLALNAARMGWWHYDPLSNYSTWDQRYAEIFQVSGHGCSNDEIVKRLHPDDFPEVWSRMEAALDPLDPQPYSAEYRILLADGTQRWVQAYGLATFEGEGEDRRPTDFAGTVADITERKLAVEQLSRSEESYRLLAENTIDVIWTMNLDLEFTYVNNSIFNMAGYTPEEWIGTRLPDHCDQDEFEKMRRTVADEMAAGPGGTGFIFETVLYGKDREPIFVEIHGKVIFDDQGRPMALQGATRDIIERKIAEKARQKIEEQFRAAFFSAPEGMSLADSKRRFFKVNPRICEILGYSEEELLGKSFNNFTHPHDRQAGRDRWTELFEQGKAVNRGEKRFIHRDGHTVWVLISNAAIKDDQGNTQYVLSHINDITQRKKMEQALRLSEQKFAAAFQHSPMWVAITTTQQGRFIDVNETFLRMSGFKREEVIGHTANELNLIADPNEQARIMNTLDEQGFVQTMQVRRRLRSGEIREMLLSAELLPAPGEPSMVVVLADITDLKKAQAEKEDLENQLLQSQKMEAIGTLAGGIAHDFNNILSAILGFTELIQDSNDLDPENQSYVNQILVAVDRAQKLVNQILTFSRKAETETKPVDLNRRVKEAVGLIRQAIPKMVSIELNLSQNLNLINADPGQLEQIVMNLATNAKDAMPEGGRLVFGTNNTYLDEEYCRDHFEAEPGHYVRLEVSDTGHGMSRELLGHIFDPFFTTKEVGKGTGLGLSTIYGIVKSHGGFIYCYSEPGQGTTFRVYFPAMLVQGAMEPAMPEPGHDAPGGNETLLLVDDEAPLRDLGARMLSREGYKVISAVSGEEALRVYQDQWRDIDLVVLDVSMPGMGGHKCLLELLRLNPKAKVLIASGYSANGQLKETLSAGAKGYIAKPFERGKILQAIRDTLDRP